MTEIVCTLPVPPSANQIWRYTRKGRPRAILSPEYRAWKRHADGVMLANCPHGGWPKIPGEFSAEIVIDRDGLGRGDLDNKIKPLLDYCQRAGLVENDRHLTSLQISVGQVSDGCRLTLRELRPNRAAAA